MNNNNIFEGRKMNKIKYIWDENNQALVIITDENNGIRYSLDNISYEDVEEIAGIADSIINKTFTWNNVEENKVKSLLELNNE